MLKQNEKPNPKLVLIDGRPGSSNGGIFYRDWREGFIVLPVTPRPSANLRWLNQAYSGSPIGIDQSLTTET